MNEDLKPCPFCGGKANAFICGRIFVVECESCGTSSDRFDTKDEAIEAWNGRTTMWRHEIIEKLRENLAELPSDMIEYNLGYAAAISDLEHIAEDKES